MMARAVAMPRLVVVERAVMVAVAVVVFVQAVGAVAFEVGDVAVEREGGADRIPVRGLATTEQHRGAERGGGSLQLHGAAPENAFSLTQHHEGSVSGRREGAEAGLLISAGATAEALAELRNWVGACRNPAYAGPPSSRYL